MPSKSAICPICHQEDHSYKISQLYLEALMRIKNKEKAETPVLDKLKGEASAELLAKMRGNDYYHYVVDSFAPPQGSRQVTRSINPDWVAFALVLISAYILYQVYFTQHAGFWFAAGLAGVALALYIVFRKRILARYQVERSKELGTKDQVERAVGRWMKLYYCSTDNLLFGAKKGEQIPLEHMKQYLLETSQKE